VEVVQAEQHFLILPLVLVEEIPYLALLLPMVVVVVVE
jgi:hypothetical protein